MSAETQLRYELEVWRAAWKQLETFLEQVDGAAEQDAPHAKAVCALLPAISVVERARRRAYGMGLAPALACAPAGTGLGEVSAAALGSTATRVPGVEELEFAVGSPRVDGDGDVTDDAALASTATLFTFRDERHGGEVPVRVPTYDFGALAPGAAVPGVIAKGLFTVDERREATEAGTKELRKWSALRTARVQLLQPQASDPTTQPLSARVAAYTFIQGQQPLLDIGAAAAAFRAEALADADTLRRAHTALEEAGIAPDAAAAVQRAVEVLQAQAADYAWAAQQLSPPAVGGQSVVTLAQVRDRLRRAEAPDGSGPIPAALVALDAATATAMDEAVEHRIAYPDGSLRQLRTLEWALRFHWSFRVAWFASRGARVLAPTLSRVLQVFCRGLAAVLAGTRTELGATGARLARQVATQALELPLAPGADVSRVQAGQVGVLGGARPALAVLLGARRVGQEQRLLVAPLEVSVATDAGLPGVPGLADAGTALTSGPVQLDTASLLRGASTRGAHEDGLVQAAVTLGSQLLLLLGRTGGPGRPVPPALPHPYPGVDAFALAAPVEPGASRLFLARLPANGTGRQPIARTGERLLVRGADEDGTWWQTVAVVHDCRVLTAQEAKADDEATGTPVPPCCDTEEDVMVLTLRDLQLPGALTRDVTVRRDFLGFGGPSLATGVVLPEVLDPATATVTVLDGGVQRTVLRDPELRAASAVLRAWLEVQR